MNVNPRQYDPEFQDPNAADSERKSQFGMQSQADMPLSGATGGSAWGQRDVVASAPVYGSDGKKVGTVQEAARDSFMVKKGFFFPHDYYIPYSAIASSDPERIVLNITSEEAMQQNWLQPPTGGTGTTTMDDTAGLAGGTTGGLPGGAAPGQMSGQPPTVYGVYGPQGPQDTVQAATERGTEGMTSDMTDAPPADQPLTPPVSSPDYAPQVPPGSAAPNRPASGSRAATGSDTAIPMGPAPQTGQEMDERQGDMPYRNTMGPMDQPDAAHRAYNPGWQGTGGSGRDSASDLPQPEADPTSWDPDQQRPNDGSRP